ncbi:MAG: TIGR04219 family outer membrane beta-barrel protein [Kangiellaceae bacterium]|nr:TIGR04219 family outer membrane beta-barrel protein [Kangiellaceae bacterium]
MNTLRFLAATALLTVSSIASADFIGIYAGANKWNYDADGDVRSVGGDVDLNNDLGWSDGDDNVYYVAFEHPVPFLPNVRIQQNNLKGSANGVASQNFTFGSVNFTTGNGTITNYDFSNTDYTLYYEVLDNWVNLDLGITGKQFDGGFALTSTSSGNLPVITSENLNLSGVVPMLYGKAQFDLPFTGWSAGATMNIGQTTDDKMTDSTLYISYEGDSGFGFEVGYRNFTIEFDDFDALSSDMTIDGFYAGLNFHF